MLHGQAQGLITPALEQSAQEIDGTIIYRLDLIAVTGSLLQPTLCQSLTAGQQELFLPAHRLDLPAAVIGWCQSVLLIQQQLLFLLQHSLELCVVVCTIRSMF